MGDFLCSREGYKEYRLHVINNWCFLTAGDKPSTFIIRVVFSMNSVLAYIPIQILNVLWKPNELEKKKTRYENTLLEWYKQRKIVGGAMNLMFYWCKMVLPIMYLYSIFIQIYLLASFRAPLIFILYNIGPHTLVRSCARPS